MISSLRFLLYSHHFFLFKYAIRGRAHNILSTFSLLPFRSFSFLVFFLFFVCFHFFITVVVITIILLLFSLIKMQFDMQFFPVLKCHWIRSFSSRTIFFPLSILFLVFVSYNFYAKYNKNVNSIAILLSTKIISL